MLHQNFTGGEKEMIRLHVSGKDVKSHVLNILVLFFDQRSKLKIHLSITIES